MKTKIVLVLAGVASLVVLGVAVSPLFLYGLFAAACPLMHLLGGHGSHGDDTDHSEDDTVRKNRKNSCH